ncbi:hypothetical protein [Streptomyces orinoci]|uniref:Gram-positive cocci surface proteins LPxTG domain-containing protein n=1 Tax=Streptomyces orinoci TaxID=67339 RepID=A0ABV3JX57_STRON|nr:hypothetical protein [Streptomyces orinoci]
MTERTNFRKNASRAAAASALTAALLGVAPMAHAADAIPAPPKPTGLSAAHDAASAPSTINDLADFFAHTAEQNGQAGAAAPGKPHIEGASVPVYTLSPDFVAGKKDVPVAGLDFVATKAVSGDGQAASVWTASTGGKWEVVNIASGDDETRYAAAGNGGTVFHEPQVNAWYVLRGDHVQPLNKDAEKAIGAKGITVKAYQERVHKAYADKLPGSDYAKKGKAGGYAEPTASDNGGSSSSLTAPAAATAGGIAVLGLGMVGVRRLRRR